jgi:hypothetical protein
MGYFCMRTKDRFVLIHYKELDNCKQQQVQLLLPGFDYVYGISLGVMNPLVSAGNSVLAHSGFGFRCVDEMCMCSVT